MNPPSPDAPVFYVARFVPAYRAPVLERLDAALGGRLVVGSGAPPGTSSLGKLASDNPFPFRHVRLPDWWIGGERLHVQRFGPLFRAFGDPAVVLAEETPRSPTLPLLLRHARRRGAGRVLWGHFSSNDRPFEPTRHPFDRYRLALARSVEACVCYTEPIADLLRPYVPDERLFVARNTLDLDPLFRLHETLDREGRATVRRRLGLPVDEPVVAFLGRLIPEKGTALLLDVFARLRAEQPAHLLVIGDGPERSAMEERVERERLPDVRFTGALTDAADLAPYLFAADALCIPGYLGLAVNHAFALGLPVVSRRAPEGRRYHSPEIAYVEHERTGMLCAWDDPADLVRGLRHVIGHRTAFSERAHAYARTYLTLDRMIRGLADAVHYAETQRPATGR